MRNLLGGVPRLYEAKIMGKWWILGEKSCQNYRNQKNCNFLKVSAPKASKSGFVGSSGRSDGPFGTDPSSSRAKYGPIMPKMQTNVFPNVGPTTYIDEYPWTVYSWHIIIDCAPIGLHWA